MHGFEHHAGYGDQGMGGFGNQGRPEEVVNNNYYGDSGIGERAEHQDHLSSDLEDRRDDTRSNFAETDDGSGANDFSGNDDASDFGSDDSSGGDDNSSGDDSSDYGSDDSN